jgi:hypothetical protein
LSRLVNRLQYRETKKKLRDYARLMRQDYLNPCQHPLGRAAILKSFRPYHLSPCGSVREHTDTLTHTFTQTQTQFTQIRTQTHTNICTCTCTCTRTCTRARAHTHTHTHTYTQGYLHTVTHSLCRNTHNRTCQPLHSSLSIVLLRNIRRLAHGKGEVPCQLAGCCWLRRRCVQS